MRTIVLATGGFDPVHSGHIAYFKNAAQLGDFLIVGINSDNWLVKKKQKAFMSWNERNEVISNLKMVNLTIDFEDDDLGSAANAIKKVRNMFPNDKIIFANGGDRTQTNISEMSIEDEDLEFVFGIGGEDKKNSSSWILRNWKED
jgi:cytidyltransferase-like protein